ncbi:glycosyltransferase [uncultured Christiangramia sp.]|uniref:glycosyltransferase n=1 Tax=Christiangramia sp. 3-2217-3z TaxID=3417564 RepID=UPI00262571B8|nr:glycosyltransferase [uncultured Christiangramia sp.]
MKILHLVTKRQYRGAEIFAATLSKELISFGHEIVFAGLYKNNKDVLNVANALNVDLMDKEPQFFSPNLALKLQRLITNEKPDIIQCNGSDTLKYMFAATYFLSNTPPIIYRNISMISKWMSGVSKRKLYQQIFQKVAHVSCVGDEAMGDFIKTFDYSNEKISVIRRGIPITNVDKIEARQNVLKRFNLESSNKLVIHMGNFSPEKNHIFLIDIFDRVKKEHPEIKLICVGEGTLYNTIKEMVVDKNLDSTVYFTGFERNVSELLAAGNCLTLCSLVEGVPGAILEAAVQRTPSISTNVGGVKEVLENDVTGFLINNFNKDEFYNKLILLTSNSELNVEMGNNSYALVVKEFGTEHNARKFEELYVSLLN